MFARVCACVPAAAAGQERAHKFEPEEKVNGEKTDEVREAPFLGAPRIFEMQARSIYQDRLGTNTGTVEKEGVFRRAAAPNIAIDVGRRMRRKAIR